ncbi:MAG: MarR family winged helix-turn-helix transcriptional regulator [Bacteroidota bacterium]
MKEVEMIQQLIEKWVTYSKTHPEPSIESFSIWLNTNIKKKQLEATAAESDWTNQLLAFGHYFGRLVNFSELWAKLAFKDLPIRTFEDYAILSEVFYKKNPTKNELAELLVNEKSTVFEILKRLIKKEILREHLDENDRRIRRVTLTATGKKVYQLATQQAEKVATLLIGDSSPEELSYLLERFKQLDHFHTAIYAKGAYKAIDDLILT